MKQNNVIDLKNPETFFDDPLTAILRKGARKLLATALEAEIEGFIARYAEQEDEYGHKRIVRNGYLPEREIQTGIGQVAVKAPRVRDRQRNRQQMGSHRAHRKRRHGGGVSRASAQPQT